jgi:hypothetical protein
VKRVLKVVVVLLLLLIVPLGAYAISLRVQYAGDPSARTRNQDAIWLGHAWVDGR